MVFVLILMLLVPSSSFAQEGALNAPLVSFLKAEVTQRGSIDLVGDIDTLTMNITIPQEDQFQKVEITFVSDDYEIITDNLGNELMTITWNNPEKKVIYEIKSLVTVNRRMSAALPDVDELKLPSELIQSDSQQIIDLAEEVTLGQRSAFEKVAALSKWTHENIDYDLKYAEVNLSALDALNNRAGVCDEYSAIIIAGARSLGYTSSYTVGYAYGRGYRIAEDFVPHGWSEVCTPEGCWPADATWAETGFVDATHIKFATLSDNYFPEVVATARGASGIGLTINPTDVSFRILDFKETPLIETENTLLDDTIWNGYAVVKTDMSLVGCALTKVLSKSCISDGKEFFEPAEPEKLVYLCDSQTIYSIFEVPTDLNKNVRYTCDLIVYPYAGEDKRNEVVLDFNERFSDPVILDIDKTTLVPGEEYSVSSAGAHVFTDTGEYALDSASWKAPSQDFKAFAYRDGSLDLRDINVVVSKPFDVTVSSEQDEIKLGESATVAVQLTNLLSEEQVIRLTLGDETRTVTLAPDATETTEFTFTPSSEDNRIAQVFASSSTFSSSASVHFNVEEDKGVAGALEGIIDSIMAFFSSLFGALA